MKRLRHWLLLSFLLLLASGSPVRGQGIVTEPLTLRNPGWHLPGTALSARVQAQASLIRSAGQAAVNHAQARKTYEETVRLQLENSLEEVRVRWERRRIQEEERAKRSLTSEERRRRINSRTWQRLKLHPELAAPQIIRGAALNFLFFRLSATALTQNPRDVSDELDTATLNHLRLTPNVLHQIQLQQSNASNSLLVFRADEGVPLPMEWWPSVLRGHEYSELRNQLVQCRQAVERDAQDGTLEDATLDDLRKAFIRLEREFVRQHPHSCLGQGALAYRRFRQGRLFLKSLKWEIGGLVQRGDADVFNQALRFQPQQDESHLPALLAFMSRNGLQFAPAQPGEEPAYFTVFNLLRDYYLAYENDDEGIQDEKARRSAS